MLCGTADGDAAVLFEETKMRSSVPLEENFGPSNRSSTRVRDCVHGFTGNKRIRMFGYTI